MWKMEEIKKTVNKRRDKTNIADKTKRQEQRGQYR